VFLTAVFSDTCDLLMLCAVFWEVHFRSYYYWREMYEESIVRQFAFRVLAFKSKVATRKLRCWYAMGWATGWGPKSVCLWWWWRENYCFHRE